MAVFVLIHSPFVGALTWRPTARALEQKGHSGIVPSLGRINPPFWTRYADVIAEAIHTLRTQEPLVLVAHGAVGMVLPVVGRALHRELPGDHLHMLVRPTEVADCRVELA